MTPIPELAILVHLLKPHNYTKYMRYINVSKEFKELTILYNTLELLHQKFPEKDKSVDELESYVLVCYPRMAKSEIVAIADLCEQIRNLNVSDDVAQALLGEIRKRAIARELALVAFEYSNGNKTEDEFRDVIKQQETTEQAGTDVLFQKNFVTDRLDVLKDETIDSPGLSWPLACLNSSLGPLRRGDFGFAFARPEAGKTTFLAHTTAHMARFATRPLIWFNNEEQGSKVRVRTFQAALGYTTDELFRNIERSQRDYDSSTNGLIRIYDDASIHRRDVESIVDSIKPDLIIFDQIDKIKGFDADRPDLVFGRIYQWARELAKVYCPVIGVCQADGTGEGVQWLTMGHVAEAKTTKQAEADWILGIGRSNQAGMEFTRHFNISKNKLMGNQNTDPELRHGRFDVWIRPQIARYEDIA